MGERGGKLPLLSMELPDLSSIDIDALPEEDVRALLAEVEALQRAEKFGKFYTYFPDTGPLRRELYPRHMEFIRAGKDYVERCFRAANRIGKTELGAFESTAHLTGDYPHWWDGWKPNRAIKMWAAGETNETTRDIIQKKLLGEIQFNGQRKGVDGSGMIPAKYIVQDSITWKAGVADLIDTVKIKHLMGGTSLLGFKAYAQGRGSMQGTEQDLIWADEEPPMDVYNEMLIRLMTTGGRAMLTFTPLSGATEVVESFEEDRR